MELNVNDIASALQIIDVVAKRGAFAGEELTQVGMLRDRLAAFVKAAQEQAAAEQEKVDAADPAE